MAFCPNLSSPQVAKNFEELTSVLGEPKAYLIWNANKGNHIDTAPNGKPSILFNDLVELTQSRNDAIELKSKVYSSPFKSWFKNGVVDENNEPQLTNGVFTNEEGDTLPVREKPIVQTTEVRGDDRYKEFLNIINDRISKLEGKKKEKFEYEINNFIEEIRNNEFLKDFSSVQKVMSNIKPGNYKAFIEVATSDIAFATALNSVSIGEKGDAKVKTLWDKLKKLLLSLVSDVYTKYDEFTDILDTYLKDNTISVSTPVDIITEKQLSFDKNNDLESKLNALDVIKNKTLKDALQEDNIALSYQAKQKILDKTDSVLKAFLSDVGIQYQGTFDSLLDSDKEPMNAIAKADLLAKIVEVVENKRDLSTLPEEAAHIFIKLLDPNSKLYKTMVERADKYALYEEVKASYNDVYNGDDTKIREEVVAKLISAHILNEIEMNDTPANNSTFKRWWERVWDYIKNLFKNSTSKALNPYVKAAKDILNRNIEGLRNIDEVIEEADKKSFNLTYYELSSEDKTKRDTVIAALEKRKIISSPDGKGYQTLDGKTVLDRVSNYVKAYYRHIFRNVNKENEKSSTVLADKGTFIHKMSQIIMNELINKTDKNILFNFNNAGKYIQQARREIIAEYPEFRERNEKFTELSEGQYQELVGGIINLFNQINKNAQEIAKSTGEDATPRIFTELMIYDEKRDLAGTIDLAVVYPNGAVAIYDYKGIQFKELGSQVEDLPQFKIEAYDIQLSNYKRILSEIYGIKDFAESRIVPINMQVHYKEGDIIEEGFRKLEFGKRGVRDYLEQIPVADELTTSKDLNESLQRMFNTRKALQLRLKTDYNNLKLKERYNKLDRAIQKLQLERDVDYVYREIAKLYKEFDLREKATQNSPDAMDVDTLAEFLEYRQYLETFTDFAVNAINYLDEIKSQNPGLRNSIDKIPRHLETMRRRIDAKLIDHVNTIDETDIRADVVETSKLGRLFKQLHDYDQPMFRKMAVLVEKASEQKRTAVNDVIEVISGKRDALEKWADKKGISLYDAYRMMLNKQKNLISQFDKTYWEDFKKAKESKGDEGFKWLKENTIKKTDEMLADRAAYFKILDEEYTDKEDAVLKEDKKNRWDSKFNFIKNEKSALTYKYNPYVQLKDNPKRYSKEYTEMLKPGNESLYDFYKTLIEYNEKFNNLLDRPIKQGFVAEVRQDTIDKIAQVGILKGLRFKTNILNALETQENDLLLGSVDAEGKPIPVIPLLYTNKLREKLTPKELKQVEDELDKENIKPGTLEYSEELKRRTTRREYEKGLESKSIDLTTSLILFAETVYTNQFFSESEDTIKALQTLVHDNVPNTILTDTSGRRIMDKVRGVVAKKLGLPRDDVDAFDKFVELYWYGRNIQNEIGSWKGGKKLDKNGNVIHEGITYSGNKLAQMIMSYTSLKALAFKPILAAGNALGILTNTYMLGAEGLYFDESQLRKARNLVLGSALKQNSKAIAAAAFFEPSARNLIYEKANKLSGSKLTRLFTIDNAFVLHKKPDDAIDAIITIAMMQNYGIAENGEVKRLAKLPEGSKSLWDLTTFDGKKISIEGFNEKQAQIQYNKFRRIIRSVSTKIKGSIPDDNKSLIGTTMEGRLLMQFRGWIPGLAATRFKKLSYNADLDELDVGRVRVLYGELARSGSFVETIKGVITLMGEMMIQAPGISRLAGKRTFYANHQRKAAAEYYYNKFKEENPELAEKVSYEDYLKLREAKLKGMAKEFSMLLSFIALTSFMKAAIPDDDEKYLHKNFAVNTYRMAQRGLLEILFWYDPTTVTQIMDKPIVSISAFTDVYKWIGNTVDVTFDIFKDEDDPKRAVFKKAKQDKKPLGYETSRMFPFVNSIVDWLNLWDKPVK